MNLRNSVTLIGYLGQDPEFTTFDSGKTRARFSLATSDSYKNQNGDRVTTTEWHSCVAWGKLAEVINKWLKKGKQVAVRGKLVYNSYEDKNGVKRYFAQVLVEDFVLLGKREEVASG